MGLRSRSQIPTDHQPMTTGRGAGRPAQHSFAVALLWAAGRQCNDERALVRSSPPLGKEFFCLTQLPSR